MVELFKISNNFQQVSPGMPIFSQANSPFESPSTITQDPKEQSRIYPYNTGSENNLSPNITNANISSFGGSNLNPIDSSSIITELKGLLSDVSISCESSVLILDDLLLYDKIESGHLTLKYEKVPFIDYLMKWLRVYQLEVNISSFYFFFLFLLFNYLFNYK